MVLYINGIVRSHYRARESLQVDWYEVLAQKSD